MWIRHGAAAVITAGAALFASACAATVEEPLPEDVDVEAEAILWRPRILRPNPIDPGGRLLRCLPDPRKRYVVRDSEACATVRFFCAEGEEAFFDRCGCGCFARLSLE